jgi:hypothetical protein
MRGTLLAILVAGGIGLAGTAAVSAAPVINGSAIGNAASENSPITTVQHWRWAAAAGSSLQALNCWAGRASGRPDSFGARRADIPRTAAAAFRDGENSISSLGTFLS